MPQLTFTMGFTIEISHNRLLWLEHMARQRHQTLEKLIESLIHNATLDHQQGHYPNSSPDDSPTEAWLQANPNQRIVE